ncbi:hypothetical protein KQI36_06060 [Clostridium senegalense]|uniref:DUF5685 family protein n=1 Tax=Clostridium senegalense TaxID=1465809 RepID=UPI001C116C42|nr:DUF5685 family protein [Clostridium senegalense]MBU5226212.1 hypothetical protein [Clostridium senegalense]
MFGYVTPCKMELKVKDYEKFKAYYCGLCLAIKNNFGNLPRFTLNYDMTFLGILLDSLNNEKIQFNPTVCIAHPMKKKLKVINNGALDYAAFCNVALAYFKLLDNFQDDNSKSSKILAFGLKGYINTTDDKKNYLLNYMEDSLKNLSKIENSSDILNIDEVAHIFADLTGTIICEYATDNNLKDKLYNLGYNLGRFIYLIDGYDDLEKDMSENKFNPINRAFNNDNLPYDEFLNSIKDRIEFNLIMSAEGCVRSLSELSILKNKDLLDNILNLGLMEKIENIKTHKKE